MKPLLLLILALWSTILFAGCAGDDSYYRRHAYYRHYSGAGNQPARAGDWLGGASSFEGG